MSAPATKQRRILGKREILDARDHAQEIVDVPEWGGAVIVRTMTGSERDSLELEVSKHRTPDGKGTTVDNFRARVLIRCIVDERGDTIFSHEELAQLASKSAAAIERLFDVALRLNGMTQRDVDELGKGSGPTPGAGLRSA